MVPLSALTTLRRIAGPEFTQRYNLYRAAQIFGGAAPGYSSGQAMKALEDTFAETMPREMGFDYAGMSFQEQVAQKGVVARWWYSGCRWCSYSSFWRRSTKAGRCR